jgi:hypothetical protein
MLRFALGILSLLVAFAVPPGLLSRCLHGVMVPLEASCDHCCISEPRYVRIYIYMHRREECIEMHIEEHISMHPDSHNFKNSLDVLCPLTSFFLFLLIFMLRQRSAEGTAINKHLIVEELSWELGC